jgi:hypothetical protein
LKQSWIARKSGAFAPLVRMIDVPMLRLACWPPPPHDVGRYSMMAPIEVAF